MAVTTKVVTNSVTKRLNELKKRINSEAVIARQIWPMYQTAQVERFKSNNATEGETWNPLSPLYYKWKSSRSYFNRGGSKVKIKGGGTQTLVLTGALYNAIMAKSGGSRVITPGKMTISITLDYASFVNDARDFVTFSQATKNRFKEAYLKYVMKRGE